VISFAADAESSLSDWLADDRNTVVIEWASDPRVGLELVSWRLGQARGRVRARVGAAADSAELARVINRLCGGPQPLPPIVAAPGGSTEDRRRGASAVFTTIRPRARSADRGAASAPITIAIGPSASDGVDGGDAARVEYLVDCLESAGRTTRTRRGGLDAVLDESGDGPAILHGYAPTAEMIPLVEQRRTAGRLTVLDLTADLLDRPVGVEASSLAIDEATRALARSCGALLCPSRSIATELSEPELATLALPTRPTRRQIDTMLTAGVRADPGLVVGWRVDPAPQAEQAAVGRALELLLDRAPDLAVELCGPRADGIHLQRARAVVSRRASGSPRYGRSTGAPRSSPVRCGRSSTPALPGSPRWWLRRIRSPASSLIRTPWWSTNRRIRSRGSARSSCCWPMPIVGSDCRPRCAATPPRCSVRRGRR
jgi:hypothetical protein